MQKCRMCGNPVEKNAALCPSCGVERICLNCGYKLEESFNYCPNCGELRSFRHINFTDYEDSIEFAVPIGNILKIKKKVLGPMSFNEAKKCCTDGWRLPTMKELSTIYKIREICGIEQKGCVCWSSSAAVGDASKDQVWCFDFNSGTGGYCTKKGRQYFYLVCGRNADVKNVSEKNTIYYEASKKLESEWIDKNSEIHRFADGKGEIKLKKSVTKIEHFAFACLGQTSLIIPDCITEIEFSAFSDCCTMKKLVIGNSVKTIGSGAFEFCLSLEDLTFGISVEIIEDNAFFDCMSLKSLVIPSSVNEIGWRAFADCGSLESVIIPDSVKKIGEYAFEGCNSLQSLVMPDYVEEIGVGVFDGCDRLAKYGKNK